MTTYNTGNAIGSVDVRDLYDNAQNLDQFSNSPSDFATDRLGVSRETLQGIRNASQYQFLGAYAAGLVFTSYNQVFSNAGEFYAPSAGLTLPYTTTGSGAAEIATFRSVGDAILRQDLANSADPVKGAALVAGAVVQVDDVAALRLLPGRYDGDQVSLLGYYAAKPGVGGGMLRWNATSTATDNGGSVIAVTGVVTGRWLRDTSHGVFAEWFGAHNDNTETVVTTAAVWSAIEALRSAETELIQYIGGPTITAYKSGKLNFGAGTFALSPDSFAIFQDLGLTLSGQGSRGKNQAIPATTTLLFKGISSGFCIQHFGNGARSLRIEDMDVCYENADFTGDVIDSFSSPGLSIERARLGCLGGFAIDRVQTARSLLRTTYDEFVNCKSVVFDGAVDAWWSDNSRTLGASIFGGWGSTFDACTFYDAAGVMFKHDATRTRVAVNFRGCAFNPINISPVRGMDVDNIEGLVIEGCQFTPSTSSQPTAEWLRILGSTGKVQANAFSGSTSKVGTFGGANPNSMDFSYNRIACLDGLTLTGGIITGKGNEFSNGDIAWDVIPSAGLTLDIGPDIFKSGIGQSIVIAADSTLLGGRVNYDSERDASASKFTSASNRVTIENLDKRFVTVSTLPSSGATLFSGRTYNVTAASGTFTLPLPVPGTRIRVMKSGATALTIAAAATTNFAVGDGNAKTSAVATASQAGAGMEFVALNSTSWIGQVLAGAWAFS